jgi:glycosyltransferase involved in cell wall biosynthesis
MIGQPDKHFFIRNYPDDVFVNEYINDPDYKDFEKWLNGEDYIFLQGIHSSSRYPKQTIDSIMAVKNIKAVVLGPFNKDLQIKLFNKYGNVLYERIYFRGRIDLLMVPKYIANSKFSLIFYEPSSPTNRYCEPNRMYQALALGRPVIVGNNESMSEIVKNNNFGISLNGFGEDVNEITQAIELLMKNYRQFHDTVDKNKHQIMWSTQESIIEKIFNNDDKKY